MADRPTCQDCRFWDFRTDPGTVRQAALGYCRRRSPREFRYGCGTDGLPKIESSEWPATRPQDWCGEHERKGIQEVNINESFVVSVGDLEENGNVPLEWVKEPNGGKTS